MARPQALRDALYYPTQERVLNLFLDKVRLTPWSAIKLLDPCIGEGTAVKALADRLGREASVWGVELSLNRARKAARLFKKDQVAHGSFFDLKCEDSSFHVVFCNPPYHTSEEASKRQEVDFLERITPLLCHYGVLIYVIPKHILSDERFVDLIRSNYKVEMILDYPEPEVHEFNQCFLVATKEDTNYVKGAFEPLVCSEVLNPWTRVREIRVPANSQVLGRRLFQVTEFDPERWKDKLPVYSNSAWATLAVDAHQAYRQPLVAPRFGHQAMLLTAGQLNGADLGGFLVKGGTEKVTTRTTDGDTLTERESLVSRISTISMETGEFDTWLVSDETTKTVEWFEKNGTALAKAMIESHTPQFGGEVSPWESKFARLKAPGKLWGREKEEILDLQKQAACAINQRWKSHKTVVLSGEMGVGKTTIGIVANELYGNPKTVVVGPTHLVKKWVREANKVVGRPIAATAKTLSEVDAFFASDLKLLVLSKDRAKLGARWRHTDHRFLRGGQKCPDCGKRATEFLVKALDGKEKGRCYHCEAPLWQTTPISAKGTKRWALAKYINQKYAHRYNLIIDEAHNYAGADSDQSRAIQLLSSGSEKILAMTGTLYGGRASAIFHLLYKVSPEFRARYGFKDSKTFVEHMGLFEKTYKLESQSSVYGYRRANTGVRVKEIAGMSPNLIPMLLPFCIFLKLKDLNVELPAYTEELIEVDPDPEIEWAYGRLKDQIMNSLRKYPRIMSSFLQAGLGYVDFAENGEEIQAKNDDGEVLEVFTAPPIIKEVLPKDLEVLRLAQENKGQGGKTLVYMTQVITRDARGRVKRLLEKNGLKVSILDASVPPEDREEWLTKEVEAGFDVLITNGRLVETGLDLIWANLIIQYGIEYSVPSLRQSIRRSWRLGQTRAVRVVFLSYRNTMQEIATRLIAKKMKAAELVDGDDIHGLAQMDESGNDFFLELAQEVFRGYC